MFGCLSSRRQRDLPLESPACLVRCQRALEQQLQRHGSLGRVLGRLVDQPHAAATDELQDVVAGNLRDRRRLSPHGFGRTAAGHGGLLARQRRALGGADPLEQIQPHEMLAQRVRMLGVLGEEVLFGQILTALTPIEKLVDEFTEPGLLRIDLEGVPWVVVICCHQWSLRRNHRGPVSLRGCWPGTGVQAGGRSRGCENRARCLGGPVRLPFLGCSLSPLGFEVRLQNRSHF